MLGISKAFEETVCGAQCREGEFRAIDQRSKSLVVALAGFTKEHGLDGATGAQSFFNESDAFDPDEPVFRWQAAAESEAKLLEPAIVAAGEDRGTVGRLGVASGFAGRGHRVEVSKFSIAHANS
jgi:hypothetical protein